MSALWGEGDAGCEEMKRWRSWVEDILSKVCKVEIDTLHHLPAFYSNVSFVKNMVATPRQGFTMSPELPLEIF